MKSKILGEIRQYRGAFVRAALLMACSALTESAIPVMTSHIIDEGITGKNLDAVWTWGAGMLVLALLAFVCALTAKVNTAKAVTGHAANLRIAVFRAIQSVPTLTLDKYGTASLVMRTTTDITNIQGAVQVVLDTFFSTPVGIIGALILASSLNWQLSLLLLAGVVVMAVLLAIIMFATLPVYRRVYDDYDGMNEHLKENIAGIAVVKSFAREDDAARVFEANALRVKNGFTKAEKLQALNNPVMMIVLSLCFAGIGWIGALLIGDGQMTTGALSAFITYAFQIMSYMAMLILSLVQIVTSLASIERVKQILGEEALPADANDALNRIPNGSVAFDHVSFRYGEGEGKDVVSDISFAVESGEFVGVVGATGSSKTTMLSLISRMYEASSGSIRVGGADVGSYSREALAKDISWVPQSNVLFTGTVLDNLRFGKADADEQACEQACRKAEAWQFVQEMDGGLHARIEQGGANLSGGQRQRLCLARALIRSPRILILDDALSALDNETESKIRHTLKRESAGMTVFMVTQRMSQASGMDRVIVMDKGRIDAMDTPTRLLEGNAIYRQLNALEDASGEDGES